MRRRCGALCLIVAFALLGALRAEAQAPESSWIERIEIASLAPFEVTFRFSNRGTSSLDDIEGQTILQDRLGQVIEVVPIRPISAAPGQTVEGTAAGRWDFQRTGIYLVEVALDLGGGGPISSSLAFRILPIPLPLEPAPPAEGEGLYTVYQQPVNWGLVRIAAPEAWWIQHGAPSVVVAVIDSGIDTSIPQLRESLWVNEGEIPGNGVDDDRNGYVDDINGWDFRDGDNSSLVGTPIHWHGTFAAGIIAARPGELPIVGVAPGVRIMDVRFLNSENQFLSSDWRTFAEAVDYAVDNGARIINLSVFANGRPPAYFEDAIRRAAARGVLIVGISGNTGEAGVLYPARYDVVYAVSATTEDDLAAGFSSHGPEVFACAPGERIVSFVPGGGTSTRSGTSFAAPHVSGVLALILSAHPGISPGDAIAILRRSLVDLGTRGFDEWFGYGLVNAYEAVSD
jgi:subtilisin family serine protease